MMMMMMHLKKIKVQTNTLIFFFSPPARLRRISHHTPITRTFSSQIHKASIFIPPTKTPLYVSFFCTLIRLYLSNGRFSTASATFSHMRALALVPTLPFWNTLLYQFNASGLVSQNGVMPLFGEELHLVAIHLWNDDRPCLWGFVVPMRRYNSSLVMLNLKCLGIVFDLDETLVVANTVRSFEDRIDALHRPFQGFSNKRLKQEHPRILQGFTSSGGYPRNAPAIP